MQQGRNRIKELRGVRGLTLAEIGAELGVDKTTVGRWEKHETDVPRKHWQPLARLLRVQVPWLLGIEDIDADGDNGVEVAA